MNIKISTLVIQSKEKLEKKIEKYELEKIKKDLNDEYRILERDLFARVAKMLIGKTANSGPAGLKSGNVVNEEYLNGMPKDRWSCGMLAWC